MGKKTHYYQPEIRQSQFWSDYSSNRGSLMVARDFQNVLREHARDLGDIELQVTVERLLAQLGERDCVMLSKAIKRTPN